MASRNGSSLFPVCFPSGFRSITEAIDTTTPAGRMMMQMVGAFADDAEFAITRSDAVGVWLWPTFRRHHAPHNPGPIMAYIFGDVAN